MGHGAEATADERMREAEDAHEQSNAMASHDCGRCGASSPASASVMFL